mmetsp:Transcript_79581/g.190942  ORF Transcript_79581/g.190942 Transcript_79581/m.190942 type:complete len:211 (-) Transcript_79581:463-1095(-)
MRGVPSTKVQPTARPTSLRLKPYLISRSKELAASSADTISALSMPITAACTHILVCLLEIWGSSSTNPSFPPALFSISARRETCALSAALLSFATASMLSQLSSVRCWGTKKKAAAVSATHTAARQKAGAAWLPRSLISGKCHRRVASSMGPAPIPTPQRMDPARLKGTNSSSGVTLTASSQAGESVHSSPKPARATIMTAKRNLLLHVA